MNKKIVLIVIVILLIIVSLIVKMNNSNNINKKISIIGNITNINIVSDTYAVILVEGELKDNTLHDKASVKIDKNTKIKDNLGNNLNVTDLKDNDVVEIMFEGPVATSYPVQAYASKILVVK
ncbi:hypothetical protein D3C73_1182800 [compost metagenome]